MADILLQKHYPQKIERVWQALTNSEELAQWLMPNNFCLELNYKFQFQTKPQPFFDGIVNCEIIEIIKPTLLVYTWQGGMMKKPTIVRWELKPVEDGTEVTLSHTGFDGFSGYFIRLILSSGWKKLLSKQLLSYLNNGK